MIKKIDHIGIAVHSLEESKSHYEETLGLKCLGEEEVESQKVKTAFFDVDGVHIELLEPTAPDSPIAKFLEKKGPGVHHIAFASDNIEGQLEQASSKGCKLINEKPIQGAGGKQVAFLHPKSTFGVLTEICSGGHCH
ncbi:MAG: methylmalonyl-CoA epimerase [Planctomycetes bacterium]|nr:methylmalonyl-CoA epimerase [Planctomycetota bacterium]